MQYIWGVLGILGIFIIAIAFSKNRRAIHPRTVIGAFAIQFIFALVVLKWDFGKKLLEYLASIVQSIINSTNAGIQFLFGGILGAQNAGFTFALQVLPIIIFFSSLISILYYLGIM